MTVTSHSASDPQSVAGVICCAQCYLPLFVPFPLPTLSILSALGGIGWQGSVLLQGGGSSGSGSG